MRSIWKGSLSFGLVNVPVKLYSATEDHDAALHQVHEKDGGRIRYKRVCEIDGKEVPYEEIAKAYVDGDQTVILTDDDFAALPVERSKDIDVVEFVPTDQIDPIMLGKAYFLSPDSKSNKAYVLLRRTLEDSDRTAIVKFALRQKTRLAVLRVRDDILVLQSLLWEDEVREARFPELDETPRISADELKMGRALVDSFASDFTPEKFTDDYQEQLKTLIEAKLDAGDAYDTEATFGRETEEGGEVLDLMEALRRSVEQKRGGADEKTPAKKAPAAKKPAAKKKAS
jgi:DNA end-binding protein Ku